MEYVDFIMKLHKSSNRDYIARVTEDDKSECAEVAIQYGKEYWDGERKYGYGGYQYDGRWNSVAKAMIEHYQIKSDAKILDVGCGKGYLLHEFKQILPDCKIYGIDISEYAISNAKEVLKCFRHFLLVIIAGGKMLMRYAYSVYIKIPCPPKI